VIKRPAADRRIAALRTLEFWMDCSRACVPRNYECIQAPNRQRATLRQLSVHFQELFPDSLVSRNVSFDTVYYRILGSGFPIYAGDSCLLMILGSSCGA